MEETNNNRLRTRRSFLQNTTVLAAGLPLMKYGKLTSLGHFHNPVVVHHDTPKIILSDPRVSLKFGNEKMVLNEGLQPWMFYSPTSGIIVIQAALPKKTETVISRDNGDNWDNFSFPAGKPLVSLEGGATQLRDGTVLILNTSVTPGESPDLGKGLLYTSDDNWNVLQGPFTVTFNIPEAEFFGSTNDNGKSYGGGMRLHRRIIELPNGYLLTTLYGRLKGDDTPSGYMPTMKKMRVILLLSTNKGLHWNMISTVASGGDIGTEGFDEPVITRISKGPKAGRILCFMRTGRELYETFSDDDGYTWVPPRPRVFADIDVYRTDLWAQMFKGIKRNGLPVEDNPVESIGAVVDPDLIELRSGVLVAAFGVRIPAKACFINPAFPWNGNYLAFSLDHGITWSHVVQLTSGIPTTQYMAIDEMKGNNKIFAAYDFGYWGCKEGRYIYSREINISIR